MVFAIDSGKVLSRLELGAADYLEAIVARNGAAIALYSGETSGPNSIVNQYATIAYLAAGLVGGWVYWLLSGRYAGDAVVAEMATRTTTHGGSAKAGSRS